MDTGLEPLGTHDVMGIPVAAADASRLTDYVFGVGAESVVIVGYLNLHGLYLDLNDDGMREFYAAADVVHADGMPIVWIGRLLGHPFARHHRITYVDWLPTLLARAEREGKSALLLGGPVDRAESTERVVRARYPSLQFRVIHGYFAPTEEAAVAAEIERWGPALLFVGMGMPRQEHWILRNLERLPSCVVMDCGAAFDYLAGYTPVPPRIFGRIGLEWLYRFVNEPRRLARRYFIEPWFILPTLLRELYSRWRR